MRAWDAEFPECAELIVNVNLSARQCLHPTLVGDVARVLAETGLAPERLKLEITESLVLEGSDEVIGDPDRPARRSASSSGWTTSAWGIRR